MSDQEQTENSGGIGVSGMVGGLAAAGGTAYGADHLMAGSAIKKHIKGETVDAKLAEKTQKVVNEAFAADAKVAADAAAKPVAEGAKAATASLGLAAKKAKLDELKAVDPKKINEIYFSEAKDGVHTAYLKSRTAGEVKIEGIAKLPEGAEAGKTLAMSEANYEKILTGEKSFLKDAIASEEKGLISGLRSASGKFGFAGVKTAGLGGKSIIAAGTVAAAVVGAKVAHSIFGGKHADQVAANRNDVPEQGAARAS